MFEILLRAQLAPPRPTIDGLHIPDDAALAQWKTTGTALVVDDEAGVRDLVRAVLQRMGFQVIVATDGRSAIELFRAVAGDVRLTLIDLMMPGLNGQETLAIMRELKPDLPAILMSGYTGGDAAASEPFLQKPFTPATIRRAVFTLLRPK
jgi:CheY-like chemotaxis protein